MTEESDSNISMSRRGALKTGAGAGAAALAGCSNPLSGGGSEDSFPALENSLGAFQTSLEDDFSNRASVAKTKRGRIPFLKEKVPDVEVDQYQVEEKSFDDAEKWGVLTSFEVSGRWENDDFDTWMYGSGGSPDSEVKDQQILDDREEARRILTNSVEAPVYQTLRTVDNNLYDLVSNDGANEDELSEITFAISNGQEEYMAAQVTLDDVYDEDGNLIDQEEATDSIREDIMYVDGAGTAYDIEGREANLPDSVSEMLE